MIFDAQSLFSDAQALTTVGAAASTNVIDLGAAGTPKHAKAPITRDLGKGRPIEVLVQAVEDFAQTSATATLTIALQVDDAENFGSAETVATTAALGVAALKAGSKHLLTYLPEGVNKRYMRLLYTVGGKDMSAGKITAGLVFGHQTWAA